MAAVSVCLFQASCRSGSRFPTVSGAWDAFGTVFSIAAWGPDSGRLRRAMESARDSVRLVDSLLSAAESGSDRAPVWRSGAGDSLSPALMVVLRTALEVTRRVEGTIDGTGVDWRRLRFDSATARAALSGGDALDLGWVARGYALDQALLPLETAADSAILTMGGQYLIMTRGVRDSAASPGRDVGVVNPDNTLATVATIEVPPGIWAVSTTSPVERPDRNLEPRAGPRSVRSVTTMAHHARTALAWSTAFYRLGCERALALARELDGVEVLCVDDRPRWSPGLDGRVRTATDSVAESARAPEPGHALAGAPAENGSRNPAASLGSSRSGPRTN
jgi:ApbE family